MSHHFDTPTARLDPRINLCDFYLFRSRPGRTAMLLTVNPDAGLSAPDTFRDEGLYAFRFDLDGDAREELTFKFRFGPPSHADDDEHRHVQSYEVRRAIGAQARSGAEGELIAAGTTGSIIDPAHGVSLYAGLAPEPFAGNAVGLGAFRKALSEGRYDSSAFDQHQNYFAGRNVCAIVLEVPNALIGSGLVHAWASVSLLGHAPEVQVSRWGLPLITNIFMPEMDMREDYNRSIPAEDRLRFAGQLEELIAQWTSLAGSVRHPRSYAQRLTAKLLPTMLPYELDSDAAFSYASFNGRDLGDDAMDVMLTLATNTALSDGVMPDRTRTRAAFPYVGLPYTTKEQASVVRHGMPAKK